LDLALHPDRAVGQGDSPCGISDVSALAYGVWALLGAAMLVLWLRSRAGVSGVARPSEVVRRLASDPLWRVAFVVAVMFAGWHLFAR
jgi:hypothetical protein